jgi:hypothetical protein
MTSAIEHSVLVGTIMNDAAELSMSFTESMIQLQRRMAVAGKNAIPVQIEFFNSVAAALDFFKNSSSHSRLVLLDGDMGCDIEYILKDHPYPIVVGCYPMRSINWERISSYITTQRDAGHAPDPEIVRQEGCIYNFKEETDTCVSQTYLPVKEAQAKVVNIHRHALDDFQAMYTPLDRMIHTHESQNIVVDLSTKIRNPGPYDFAGIVGKKLLERHKILISQAAETPAAEITA